MALPDGRGRFRPCRPDLARPELRLPAHEEALLALQRGRGQQHHRHAQGRFPQGVRDGGRMFGVRSHHDHPLRPGVDAALRGFAEHPHHGHDPAAAGQHGHGRGWHQRAARARQRARHHRHVSVRRQPAGLHAFADRRRGHAGRLPHQAHTQDAASGADELLEQLLQVLRQPDESLLRPQRHRRQQLRLRLAAEDGWRL